MSLSSRHILVLVILAAPLSLGCFRTLHYPSVAHGPEHGRLDDVAPLSTPTPPKKVADKSTPKAEALVASNETWVTSNKSSAQEIPAQNNVARRASSMVGDYSIKVAGKRFRMDCSGFVRAVFYGEGVDLFSNPSRASASGTEYIYRYAQKHGRVHRGQSAKAGDIVFFHNTYDRNKNKKRDDRFTHVAIVVSVKRDGTMTIAHAIKGQVKLYHMNLKKPDVHRDPASGKVINDYLRRSEGGHPSKLMSDLFTAFGQVETSGRAS